MAGRYIFPMTKLCRGAAAYAQLLQTREGRTAAPEDIALVRRWAGEQASLVALQAMLVALRDSPRDRRTD